MHAPLAECGTSHAQLGLTYRFLFICFASLQAARKSNTFNLFATYAIYFNVMFNKAGVVHSVSCRDSPVSAVF